MDFEFIDENEIESVKRGRKSNASPELVKALSEVPTGKVVKITAMAVDPASEDFKNDKATMSASIRTAGKLAGVKVSISWSPAGVPQVKVSKPKAKAGK